MLKLQIPQHLIAEHNTSAQAGFPDREDPRQNFNNPLHDIVCGWCGEIDCGDTGQSTEVA